VGVCTQNCSKPFRAPKYVDEDNVFLHRHAGGEVGRRETGGGRRGEKREGRGEEGERRETEEGRRERRERERGTI